MHEHGNENRRKEAKKKKNAPQELVQCVAVVVVVELLGFSCTPSRPFIFSSFTIYYSIILKRKNASTQKQMYFCSKEKKISIISNSIKLNRNLLFSKRQKQKNEEKL